MAAFRQPLIDCAERFLGVRELPGPASNEMIVGMLQLDAGGTWAKDDAVPWCSAFVNFVAFVLGYERSKSLTAGSWLSVGQPIIELYNALPGDVIIIKNHASVIQPGQTHADLAIHVGFLAALVFSTDATVKICGGNQQDAVTITDFRRDAVLGVRRLSLVTPRV